MIEIIEKHERITQIAIIKDNELVDAWEWYDTPFWDTVIRNIGDRYLGSEYKIFIHYIVKRDVPVKEQVH